jgi:hypothetical protein
VKGIPSDLLPVPEPAADGGPAAPISPAPSSRRRVSPRTVTRTLNSTIAKPASLTLDPQQLLHDPGFLAVIQERLPGTEWLKNAVILGSAPCAPEVERWLGEDTIVIALNNAHRAVSRVDFSLFSDDLPDPHKHPRTAVIGRSSPQYAPAVQRFGGVLHCGGTMAFNAAYWAIANLPYSQISFFGCDMLYGAGRSHFYGRGMPDPLRRDVSLQNLEARALRLFFTGLCHQVLFLNASGEPRSRLRLPRLGSGLSLQQQLIEARQEAIERLLPRLRPRAEAALAREAAAPFEACRHDYWRLEDKPMVWQHVREVDALWMELEPEVLAFQSWLEERYGARFAPQLVP